MKVLGLSFGRKNGNCDIVVKKALIGARSAGAEIQFVNTVNLKIDRCTGCGACDRRMEKGGPCRCVIPDDFPFIEELILEADGLVVAAPVYVLGPVGQYKNLCDRLGPSHDRAYMTQQNNKRKEAGKSGADLLDPRLFKDRFVGLISVGGARTENWVSLGLPGMHLLNFSMFMKAVDQLNLYGMGDRVNPIFDEGLMNRVYSMGENVVSCIGKPRGEAGWFGDTEGICPLCHCDLLTVKSVHDVQCPICGIKGTLRIEGEAVSVDFPQEQIERSRYCYGGLEDHRAEIDDMMVKVKAKLEKEGSNLEALLAWMKDVPEVDRNS